MLSNDKLSVLKYIDIDFCEDYVYGKQWRASFSKARKTLKAEKWELVHTTCGVRLQLPHSEAHCIL